ncbi:MAG: DUF2867 domain-containing protein [Candidatus Firestonebacteria bacterium]
MNYCDSFQILKDTNAGIDNILTDLCRIPKWADPLFKIRNLSVRIFGLKTGDVKNIHTAAHYPIGSKALYFTVLDRNDNEIVMAENDRHLNFRMSVLIDRKKTDTVIYLTTIVQFNNIWGQIYFLPVKPFHRIIVKSMLKRALL